MACSTWVSEIEGAASVRFVVSIVGFGLCVFRFRLGRLSRRPKRKSPGPRDEGFGEGCLHRVGGFERRLFGIRREFSLIVEVVELLVHDVHEFAMKVQSDFRSTLGIGLAVIR